MIINRYNVIVFIQSYSNSTIEKLRCSSTERLEAFGCPRSAIHKAPYGSVQVEKNEDFQDVITDRVPIQLKPQKISIKIRPKSTEYIRMQYRSAKYVKCSKELQKLFYSCLQGRIYFPNSRFLQKYMRKRQIGFPQVLLETLIRKSRSKNCKYITK